MARVNYVPVEAEGLTEEEAQAKETVGRSRRDEWKHFTPEFVGTQVPFLDLGELSKQVKLTQRSFQRARVSQAVGKARFDTALPISIFFIGDVHFGSVYTDYERFEREVDLIAKTPHAYIFWMANLIDNAIPAQFPAEMMANAIPPDKQVIAMRKRMEELNKLGKILGAVTSPCHEGWTWKHTGQDVNAMIFGFPDRRFPVLENGGRLLVVVGKVKYCVYAYHQVGPFESNFNETHALRQMNRLSLQMKGDVVVGAHKHFAAAEMVYEGSGEDCRPVAYLRTGTYKGIGEIHDQFTIGRYGTSGEPSAQSVVLWPDQRRIEVFLEFETGILAHNAHLTVELGK